jgi:hypothetical protein
MAKKSEKNLNFPGDLHRWLDRITLDLDLTHLAVRVALVLKTHLNEWTYEAFPSQMTIAQKLGVTDRAVRNALDALVKGGHLTVRRGGDRRLFNTYRMVVENRNEDSGSNDGKEVVSEVRDPVFRAGEEEQAFRFSSEESGTPVHENRNGGSSETGTPVPPNYLKEPSKELEETLSDPIDSSFDEFFEQYPRQESEDLAREIYREIITSGKATPEDLLSGAMRYAEQESETEVRWIKGPAKWLTEGKWKDKTRPAKRFATHSNSDFAPRGSAMALIRQESF